MGEGVKVIRTTLNRFSLLTHTGRRPLAVANTGPLATYVLSSHEGASTLLNCRNPATRGGGGIRGGGGEGEEEKERERRRRRRRRGRGGEGEEEEEWVEAPERCLSCCYKTMASLLLASVCACVSTLTFPSALGSAAITDRKRKYP